jgi:hypothetical protein
MMAVLRWAPTFRMGTSTRRKFVTWAAIILLGCGTATMTQAQGYEQEPVLAAKDLAGRELLKGPHFTTDPKVPVVGFIARFTIRSQYGTFEVHGQRMLPIRVNEVEALSALDNVSRSGEFTAAAGRAIARPVTSAASMVTRPVETIKGIPGGVSRLFARVGLAGRSIARAATAPGQSGGERAVGTTRRVGDVTITALGFEAERRRLARGLGVDPYTTNMVLSERLTDVAWVAFSGRATIQALMFFLVPYSGAMTAVSATNQAVWDTPAGDLVNMAEAKFRETGATPDQVRALMANPQYSLSALWSLALAFDRLKDVPGRDQVVEFAAVPETQDEVKFIIGSVNMLARYHEAVARIAKVSAPGPIKGETASGALVLPAPVDYISWTDALGRIVPMQDFQAPEKILFLSGQVSPLARKNLTSRGWTINESYTWAAEQ